MLEQHDRGEVISSRFCISCVELEAQVFSG